MNEVLETAIEQAARADSAKQLAASLNVRFANATASQIIAYSVKEGFAGDIGAVSSFGADSAVLLSLIAEVDANTPILFLDTGKHFEETLTYRDQLVDFFKLTDLRNIEPLPSNLEAQDPAGELHKTSTDACCNIRKVEPMARAVVPFGAWFTGRKRFQASTRAALPIFEAVGNRIRINPLAGWSGEDIAAYQQANALPEHPLIAYGYYSIGCAPCTEPSSADDQRGGRWKGKGKVECGIHLGGLDASLMTKAL